MNNQIREDLLITALEGGSNDWYLLAEVPKLKRSNRWAGKRIVLSASERVWKAVTRGQIVPINDCENETEKLGEISKERIQIGEKLMKKNSPEHWMNANEENWDAETADVWFQYVVLGEITFG